MALRRVTRRYADLTEFFAEYGGTLKQGFLMLPPEPGREELANPLKLDLVVPLVGRVGPITAQVVQRGPDGADGLQLPDLEKEAGPALRRVGELVDEVRGWLLQTGALAAPGGGAEELDALRARVAELEEAVITLAARDAGAPPDGDDDGLIDDDELLAGDDGPDGGAADELLDDGPGDAPVAGPEGPRPRGFPVPDLAGVAPALEGPLGGTALRDGMVRAAVERWTGLFTLQMADGRVRYGFWDKGGPVGWRTDPVLEGEVLGVLLLKAGQINKAQLEESLALMAARGCRQGDAFIEMGVMTFTQLIMVLGKQCEYVTQQALRESVGGFTWHPLDVLPEAFLPPPLKVPAMLYKGLVAAGRELRGDELAQVLKPRLDAYLRFKPGAIPVLKDMRLPPPERKLVEIVQESSFRLREVFSVSPLSRQATAGVLYAFIQLGFFEFDVGETREAYLDRVREGLETKKRQVETGTWFDILETHWISLPDELEASYRKVRAEFDPGAYRELPADLKALADRIVARIEEGWAVLRDERKRREYRKELLEEFMIVQSAELLAKKGEMALMRKDTRMALDCFAKALELQPRVAEYQEAYNRLRAGG